MINKPVKKSERIFPKSSIVKSKEDIRCLCSFFNGDNLQGRRVYNAEKDGWTYDSFIKKVLKKKNLLTIIKTEFGKIFGCFVSIPRTQYQRWEKDEKAFIFSLTHQTKHEQISHKNKAVFMNLYGRYLLSAGNGIDFQIKENCNIFNTSFCYGGEETTYSTPY